MTEDLHGCFEEAHPSQDIGPATEQSRNAINEDKGLVVRFFFLPKSEKKKIILNLMCIRTAIIKIWLGSAQVKIHASTNDELFNPICGSLQNVFTG